jgi:enamine deaminase RidA (YjgF/YER057c/UK114 family)
MRRVSARPRLVDVPGLYAEAPYAYAAATAGASLVFTAGACPIDEFGRVVAGGPEAQASRALDNLEVALGAAGATLQDVVKTTVYVVAREGDELVRVWRVVEERFGDWRAPSTLLGVTVLGYRDQLMEIEAVAVAG